MRYVSLFLIVFLLALTLNSFAAKPDPAMGNWEGNFQTDSYESGSLSAQVVALGKGTYSAVITVIYGGEVAARVKLPGRKKGKQVTFSGTVDVGYDLGGSYDVTAQIANGKLTGKFTGYEASGSFTMQKVYKKSPTLGAKPPEGAIVLFDGSNLDKWQQTNGKPAKWKILKDGSMQVTKGNIITKQKFGSCQIHVEFRTPFKPEARGQKRGNSGVYVQGRYEVQILDSFGLEGKDNECGAIYKIAAPRENACLPPLEWQSYDIFFHAAKFENGKKVKNAVMTVKHNGILIHDEVEIPHPTGGARLKDESKPDGLMLQDHHNPVRFRNIWIVPL